MPKLLWTLKQQIGPRPRVGHAMTYNAAAKATLLFGGFSQAARLADTWQWDGENWTQLDDIGPKARSVAAMAYDIQRQRAVLFGGQDGNNPLGALRSGNRAGSPLRVSKTPDTAPRSTHTYTLASRHEPVFIPSRSEPPGKRH